MAAAGSGGRGAGEPGAGSQEQTGGVLAAAAGPPTTEGTPKPRKTVAPASASII